MFGTSLRNLQELPDRANRAGGLKISTLKEMIRNPVDRSVDFYKSAEPHYSETSHVSAVCEDPTIGYLLFISEESHMNRKDVIDLIQKSESVWVCCPPILTDVAKSKFPNANVIQQYEFLSLTPDNSLVDSTEMMFYCCGSGDAIVSLHNSETFKFFVEKGGKNIYYIDTSQSLCLPDVNLIVKHTQADSNVSATVTDAIADDDRAVLCDVEGSRQLLESFLFFRRPEKFDLVHTGHIIFKTSLQFDKINWSWHRKKVMLQSRAFIHYKRYIYDLTEAYDTQFIKADRDVYTLNPSC